MNRANVVYDRRHKFLPVEYESKSYLAHLKVPQYDNKIFHDKNIQKILVSLQMEFEDCFQHTKNS